MNRKYIYYFLITIFLSCIILNSCISNPTSRDHPNYHKQLISKKHSDKIAVLNTILQIRSLLSEDKQVTLIVNMPIEEISSNCIIESDILTWKNDVKNKETQFLQHLLMSNFYNENNFTLVERKNFEEILSEHKLQLTGILDSDDYLAISNLIGANYILEYSYILNCSQMQIVENKLLRLIDITTGEVIISDSIEKYLKRLKKTEELIIYDERLNGVRIIVDPSDNIIYYEK